MTTTSADIGTAAIPMPFKGLVKRFEPGRIYQTKDIVKKKKKNLKEGIFDVLSFGDEILFEAKREKKSVLNGKRGVWRTIRGRHYFFPDDKSGVIPPIIKKGE